MAKSLVKVGQRAGLGAALVMAGWDFMKGQAEISEGNVGIAWTYRASGVIGIGAAAALLIDWTGIGLILVGLLFAVTILIEYFKDNKLQDWLERCLWGKLAGQRYGDIDIEMRELKLAIRN